MLYIKLHSYHWYVKGQQFFTLHTKFEEFYTEAAVHIDELAGRLLALNRNPVTTLKGCLELASVKEAEGNENAEQMVQSTVNDFSQMITELKEGMALAESSNDEITVDMFLAIILN